MKADEILRLNKILVESGLLSPNKSFHPRKSNLELFTAMIDAANEVGKETIFSLIPYYDILLDYREYMYSLLERVSKEHEGKIILFPLYVPDDDRIKSGDHVFYEVRGLIKPDFEGRFLLYDSPVSKSVLNSDLPKYAVDDFIGSGEQFMSMLHGMRAQQPNATVTGVLAIAAMESGKAGLEDEGISLICEFLKRKAIDGYIRDTGANIEKFYTDYDDLEAPLEVAENERRGRFGAEALVSMKRTPNNTLPIFWHRGKEKKWPAPFPR